MDGSSECDSGKFRPRSKPSLLPNQERARTGGARTPRSLEIFRESPRNSFPAAARNGPLDCHQSRARRALYVVRMNETDPCLDLRPISPRQRQPLISRAWSELGDGRAMLLLNDHDPLPLYYQFACEWAGGFHWEYVERGPDLWCVRLRKGNFPDPGFTPPRPKAAAHPATPATFDQALVLDTRPIFGRGETPCQAIDEAVASLVPGQKLQLIAPFEPVPLYAKFRAQGFAHTARQMDDGAWEIEFHQANSES